MASFDRMRPGENLAIRLVEIDEHSVFIDKRVHKGDLDTPKDRNGKRTPHVVVLSLGE